MAQVQSVYNVKAVGSPGYYIDNDFKQDCKNHWYIGYKRDIAEAVSCIERMFGTLDKHDIPMIAGDHPELDESTILSNSNHQKYQMLIGMLNYIVSFGHINITYAVSSFSCFVICPMKGHTDISLYVFGYLKKKHNRWIKIDFRDPIAVQN
eukprot:10239021-Ditylum_brightwellii.AAC.1